MGKVIVGAASERVMVLVGAILDVVIVHAELTPIDLGLVTVFAKLKVKSWPVVPFKLLVA